MNLQSYFFRFRSDTENEDRIQNDISKNTNIVKDKKRKKKSGAKSREKSSNNRKKKASEDIELATVDKSKDSNVTRFQKNGFEECDSNTSYQAQSARDWCLCSRSGGFGDGLFSLPSRC